MLIRKGALLPAVSLAVLCTAIAARATCTSTADCLQAIEQAQQNTRTVVAEFVQVKHVSLLDEPLVSRGRFAFKRPDRVRLSIATPQPATVVINGRDVHIPGITERDRAAFAMTPMAALFTQLGAIFAGSMQTLQESFQVSARAADSGIEMRLQPRQAAWEKTFHSIELQFAGPDLVVRQMRIEDALGDTVEVTLHDVQRNIELPDAMFATDAAASPQQ